MTTASLTSIRCRLARLSVCEAIAISILPGISYGVVNPEVGKDSTPVVLKCRIFESSNHEDGSLTIFSASCEVLEVLRSSTDVSVDDIVFIRYGVDLQAVERQYQEMERRVAEDPSWAGPAPDTSPRPLQVHEVVIAYLRPVSDDPGGRTYVPNLGFESFERVESPPMQEPDARCRVVEEGPIMSNDKECEEMRLGEAMQELRNLNSKVLSNINDLQSMNVTPTEKKALASQAEALNASHEAWEQYRDETCELAYYEHYPGSMARLVKLTCLRQLTEKRAKQLESIFFGDSDKPPEY